MNEKEKGLFVFCYEHIIPDKYVLFMLRMSTINERFAMKPG